MLTGIGVSMLCPNCLGDFPSLGARCPECQQDIPSRYVRDYQDFPPIAYSIIGFAHHGKTVFIGALLRTLDELGKRWSKEKFWYSPITPEHMKRALEITSTLDALELPAPTPLVFPQPLILQLSGIPGYGNANLIIHDISGEVFRDATTIQSHAGYLRNSSTIVWLVSPTDINSAQAAMEFVTNLTQGLADLGADVGKKNLLVVLTKCDRYQNFPPEVKAFLEGNADVLDRRGIAGLSRAIGDWIEGSDNLWNVKRRLESQFASVKYLTVSATGSEVINSRLTQPLRPRGIAETLVWLCSQSRRPIWMSPCLVQFRRLLSRYARSVRLLCISLALLLLGFGVKTVVTDAKQVGFVPAIVGIPQKLRYALHIDKVWQVRTSRQLVDAFRRSHDKDLIQISSGVYSLQEPILVRHSLTVTGDGIDKVRILSTASSQPFSFAAKDCLWMLSGVCIEYRGNQGVDLVSVHGGDFEVHSCRLIGNRVSQNCLVIGGSTLGVVSQCEMLSSAGHGVCLGGSSKGTMTGTIVRDCIGSSGIWSNGDSAWTIRRNTCNGNRIGISIGQHSVSVLESNKCVDNKEIGILMSGSSKSTLRDNDCSLNGTGIYAWQKAEAVLAGDRLIKNRAAGIYVAGDAHCRVDKDICKENNGGILIWDRARAEITDCLCESNRYCGISAGGNAKLVITRAKCVSNDIGMGIQENSSGSVVESTCDRNNHYGIIIAGGASTIVRRNQLSNNVDGIVVSTNGVCTVESNTATGNSMGILATGNSKPTIAGNTCSKNRLSGIFLDGSSRARVLRNTSSSNGNCGIVIEDNAGGEIAGNTCCDNKDIGVFIGHKTSAFLDANQCSDNPESEYQEP